MKNKNSFITENLLLYNSNSIFENIFPPKFMLLSGIIIILGYFFSVFLLKFLLHNNYFFLFSIWTVILISAVILEIYFFSVTLQTSQGKMKQKELTIFIMTDIAATLLNIIAAFILLKHTGIYYIPQMILIIYGIFGIISSILFSPEINFISIVITLLGITGFILPEKFIYPVLFPATGILFVLVGIKQTYFKNNMQKQDINRIIKSIKDSIVIFKKGLPVSWDIGVCWAIITFISYGLYCLFRKNIFILTVKEFIFSISILMLIGLLYEFLSFIRNFKRNNIQLSRQAFYSFLSFDILVSFLAILTIIIFHKTGAEKYIPFMINLYFGSFFIILSGIFDKVFLGSGISLIILGFVSLLFPNIIIDFNIILFGSVMIIWSIIKKLNLVKE